MRDDFGLQYGSDFWALGRGFLLGDDAQFSPGLLQATRAVGVSHLVAASGANLHFINRPWQMLGLERSRNILTLLSAATVLFYVATTGLSGSLWRAVQMWFLAWGVKLYGRPLSVGWNLIIVTLCNVFFFPQFIHSLSYILSSLALVGLLASRHALSGEKFLLLLPHKLSSSIISSLITGFLISVTVYGFLLTKDFPIQSFGLLGTMILNPFAEPYAWLFALTSLAHRASEFAHLHILAGVAEYALLQLFGLFAKVLELLFLLQSSLWGRIFAGWLVWLISFLHVCKNLFKRWWKWRQQKRWEWSQ